MQIVLARQAKLGIQLKTVTQRVVINAHREILMLLQPMFAALPAQHGMQLANSAYVMLKIAMATPTVFTAKQTAAHKNNIMYPAATLAQ